MAKEICISSTPHETRLAILEDDQLAEIYYERENEYTLAGSIYNGRVTRVLPGMQSAFVDIGLERDAFLYVTDFLELEDAEESDEIERAAVSGGGTPPREVRHAREERAPRGSRAERPERAERAEPKAEQQRSARPVLIESEDNFEETVDAPAVPAAEPAAETGDSESATGARRWRGRRRRRGRGAPGDAPESGETTEVVAEPVASEAAPEVEVAPEIQAEAAPVAAPVVAPRRSATPKSEAPEFVLPGESLSKYGGTSAAEEAAKPAPAAPARPASTFKPATLIESPLEWDGSGLLPGETLGRRRRPEPAVEAEEISVEHAPAVVEEVLVEEEAILPEAAAEPFVEAVPEAADGELVEEELVEEELTEEGHASHHVDPLPPQGFRLFGLGGKKKKDEEATSIASVSASSIHDEELIEEEELVAPKSARPAKSSSKNTNLDDFEEQMLKSSMRVPLEEGGYDDEEETAPAGAPQRDAGRRDRNSRSRRTPRTTPTQSTMLPQVQNTRRGTPSRRSAQTQDLPIISDLLKPGQEILVQIAKEPIAKKGARITSHIALPGRFLVFMPTVSHVGVSRKIASDEERQRLKRILVSERGEATGGFIVRTAAEGASEEELRADLRFLLHLWSEIKMRSDNSKSPALIYHDLSLIERILRDQVSSNFSNIWVDSQDDYERIVRFLNRFSPSLVRRVKMYTKDTPLFEHFGIEDEISKALRSKVWLKSGGSIVINQTEALVAIDINTGKYVGKSARLEDTIVKTNLDAVPEIVRQIRLRDLGGIIIIDFIDMDERKNRVRVMAALEEALKTDRAPTKVLQFNDFGLVAITRKRVKQSLERTLSVPCPTCQATGMVKSPVTVCNEIFVEMKKMRRHFENEDVMLRVHPETVKMLKANNSAWITEFEELVGKNILIKSDPALHPEQFDIQG